MANVPETHRRTYRAGNGERFVRLWTNEQIAEIVGGALEVVEQLDPPEDLRQLTFGTVLNMSGQMTPEGGKLAVPMPRLGMPGGAGI